mmetsp:Transcript_65493/g.147764  ORF Transcript_65493/g.147764 Transcript_65493/m.147764 type:complete len:228 (-) Transcript_65493:136-819(-)
MSRPWVASFTGVGLSRRISSVNQSASTCRVSASSCSFRSHASRLGRSRLVKISSIRRCLRITARRFTSVGCAVSTISTHCVESASKISSGDAATAPNFPWPARSACTDPLTELSAAGCPPELPEPASTSSWRSRRRRMRWWDSAALARARKWAKALETSRIDFGSRLELSAMSSRSFSSPPSEPRQSLANERSASTVRNVSSPEPGVALMTLPSALPRSFTSLRNSS